MGRRLPPDADPRRIAYSKVSVLGAKGLSRSEIAELYPELIEPAREWDRLKRNARYHETKQKAGNLSHIDKMTWSDIKVQVNRYWMLTRNGHHESEEIPALREFMTYYSRVIKAQRIKKYQHPEITPHSLGFDPRTREWPSGPISIKLAYHEKPGTIKHKARLRKKVRT